MTVLCILSLVGVVNRKEVPREYYRQTRDVNESKQQQETPRVCSVKMVFVYFCANPR